MKHTLLELLSDGKANLHKQTTRPHATALTRASRIWKISLRKTPGNDIESVGIKLALYVYRCGIDPETAVSASEQVLSAHKDCIRVVGRDPLAEVKESDARKSAGHVKTAWVLHNAKPSSRALSLAAFQA